MLKRVSKSFLHLASGKNVFRVWQCSEVAEHLSVDGPGPGFDQHHQGERENNMLISMHTSAVTTLMYFDACLYTTF